MTRLLLTTALAALVTGSAADAQTRRATPLAATTPRTAAAIPTQLPRVARPTKYTIEITPDAANLRFTARTMVGVKVLSPTRSLTLNAVDLAIQSAALTGARGQSATVTTDADAQTATFTFARPLTPGDYTLDIAYTGKINTQASGLFALDYEGASGPRRALYTQFEAPDARRMFPSFDEPQFRTPYDLKVVVPAGQMAVSNMPESRRQQRADGTTLVSFATTPPMSSYLLFLGMGEFDRIAQRLPGGTEVGIVTKRGDGEKGRFALNSTAEILPFYNDYFGQKYPLPKLDNIAGPGSSQFFGAMENWGAIFTFEAILLDDPAITTEAARQGIYATNAHEMAHQWFGNLVTMQWWDDLWLNEGFASWMESKATDRFHPEWNVLLERISGREAAMSLDAVRTTHPIVARITTVDQINEAFDAITYQKGEAVITMLEDYVGPDAWRAGVRDYMARHKYGNTVTDDLWSAAERAAGKPIKAIAADFTRQPGVPMIRVENATCSGGATRVTLTQAEFSRDNPGKAALRWQVPVIAGTVGGGDARTLVAGGRGTVTVPGCGALVVNKGQTGYYRTLYTPAMFGQIAASFDRLGAADQLGLLADNWGLGLAGYQSASMALDLVDRVPATANTQLIARTAQILGSIYRLYDGQPQRQAQVARYANAKLAPVLARIGSTPRPGEPSNNGVLRSTLVTTLGFLGEPTVLREARTRFAGLATNPKALDGPLRTVVLGTVAYNADAATWEQLYALAKAEKVPLVRAALFRNLASTKDEALARRALALALTREPGATNSAAMVSAVAASHPDLAFDFALANKAKIDAVVDSATVNRFLPTLAGGSSDPATIPKIEAFAAKYMTPQSRRPADIAIGRIREQSRVRERALPAISQWFEAHSR